MEAPPIQRSENGAGYYSLKPDIKVIAPWREWDMISRTQMIEYAEKHNIPVPMAKRGEPPYSMDANLLHISYEGNALEDPWTTPDESMFTRSVSPMQAPDEPTVIELAFEKGNPVAIDGVAMSPATILTKLNEYGGKNGIGRVDLVESRFVGMKSRGVYETPGGTILSVAHRAMESITLDRGEMHLKDDMMPRYAELVYNGFWFTPEREALQALVDKTQEYCTAEPDAAPAAAAAPVAAVAVAAAATPSARSSSRFRAASGGRRAGGL
ncbi:Argininosuccinate synthase [Tetrabaena socialis]|uniref:argininosuccinate synthase n=1 Tax=Tetrabaena socialis TaxID=47790 RepID=A0A2J8A1R7_9CHLO|nr:Argininosuccinate synthase [Tetrabaena socialis]|eukprot:PNH06476.1 Argininosuccinate synthase [Tetrabaena socialis]